MLAAALERIAADVSATFDVLLPVPGDARAPLYQAMRHAALDGGKRLRPLLLVTVAEMHGVDRRSALRAGIAVEAAHVYSLIHDDLPCMDDDDLRHGRPTVHRQFDEATAVLAGDALQAFAFEILSDPSIFADPFTRAEMVAALAGAIGAGGMVGGQMMDMAAGRGNFDQQTITRMQQMKTGALLAAAVEMGAILARIAPEGRAHLRGYARDLGLAFQIADDLLDHEGDEAAAGKALRKDARAGKQGFVTLVGPARAREQARMLVDQAVAYLGAYGAEAELLRRIARYVVERDR